MFTPERSPRETAQDVALLRRVIDAEIRKRRLARPEAPFLVVLCGLPGTGKSHFARELSRRTPFLSLGSDRLRKTLVSRPTYDREEHLRVFVAAHRLLEDLLRDGWRVIFDATNLTERIREPLYNMAQRLQVPLALVWFTAPLRTVRRRLADRESGRTYDEYSDAGWPVYCRLSPGAEPISRPHYAVDSSRDITPVLERLAGLVREGGHT